MKIHYPKNDKTKVSWNEPVIIETLKHRCLFTLKSVMTGIEGRTCLYVLKRVDLK